MEDEMRMLQLHSFITEANDAKMHQLQLKYSEKKRVKIAKTTIINKALEEYLDYKLNELEHDGK